MSGIGVMGKLVCDGEAKSPRHHALDPPLTRRRWFSGLTSAMKSGKAAALRLRVMKRDAVG
jgi:hypothetical protein